MRPLLLLLAFLSAGASPEDAAGQKAAALAAQAARLVSQGQHAAALPLLEEASRLRPNCAEYHVGAARAAVALKDYETAKQCYELALPVLESQARIDPERVNDLVMVLIRLNRDDQARRVVDEAARRFQGNAAIAMLVDHYQEMVDGVGVWRVVGHPGPLVHEDRYSWQTLAEGKRIWLRQDATNEDLERLSHQEDITAIRMGSVFSGGSGPFITDDGLRHLAKMHQLRVLGLPMLAITDDGLQYISGLTNLHVLVLMETKITDKGLVHLSRLKNLEELWLDRLPLSDKGVVHLMDLDRLKVLRFYQAPITDAGFAAFRNMRDLEDLQLGESLITDRSTPLIGTFAKLKTLDLRAKITDKGISGLASLSNLSWLCLNDNSIGDEAMLTLSRLGKLKYLYLEGTNVTDAGLTELAGLSNLRMLHLSGTPITDEALAVIAKMPNLTGLKLNETRITDSGLEKLHGLRHLDYIELRNTHISSGAIEAFKTAIPGVTLRVH